MVNCKVCKFYIETEKQLGYFEPPVKVKTCTNEKIVSMLDGYNATFEPTPDFGCVYGN